MCLKYVLSYLVRQAILHFTPSRSVLHAGLETKYAAPRRMAKCPKDQEKEESPLCNAKREKAKYGYVAVDACADKGEGAGVSWVA